MHSRLTFHTLPYPCTAMDSKTVFFIRNAQTDDSLILTRGRSSSSSSSSNTRWFDRGLNSLGRRQARMSALSLVKRLGNESDAIACIYSAPTLASLQTAAEFAAVLDVPIQPVFGLGAAQEHDDEEQPYIVYDNMAQAVNPDGAIEVLPPIDNLNTTYDEACLSLAECFVSSHAIFVVDREAIKQPLGIKQRIEACMIVETTFSMETATFAVEETFLGHAFF